MQGSYQKLALILVVAAAVSTAINIVLAQYWRRDAWPLLIGNAMGLLITLILLGMPRISALATKSGLNRDKRRELLTFGLMGSAISAPLYWAISSSDRWFLSAYLDKSILGIYSFSYNIAIIGQMLNSALLVAWRTETAKMYESDEQNTQRTLGELWGRFAVLLGLAWLAVASAGGDIIRLLADHRFHDGISVIPWLAGGVFFYGLSHLASTSLILKKSMKPFTNWYVLCAVISIALNFIFVPQFGMLGAAMVQTISFALAAIAIMWSAQKAYPLSIDFKMLLIAAATILLAGIAMSQSWSSNPLISLCYKLPAGILVAVATLYYVAPDWSIRGLQLTMDLFKRKANS